MRSSLALSLFLRLWDTNHKLKPPGDDVVLMDITNRLSWWLPVRRSQQQGGMITPCLKPARLSGQGQLMKLNEHSGESLRED
jgi:hypothetical protein